MYRVNTRVYVYSANLNLFSRIEIIMAWLLRLAIIWTKDWRILCACRLWVNFYAFFTSTKRNITWCRFKLNTAYINPLVDDGVIYDAMRVRDSICVCSILRLGCIYPFGWDDRIYVLIRTLKIPCPILTLERTQRYIQWNLSVTTTSKIKFITCDLFSNVF